MICQDYSQVKERDRNQIIPIIILSKQDGSITRDIFIPFKTIDTPIVNDGDSL